MGRYQFESDTSSTASSQELEVIYDAVLAIADFSRTYNQDDTGVDVFKKPRGNFSSFLLVKSEKTVKVHLHLISGNMRRMDHSSKE